MKNAQGSREIIAKHKYQLLVTKAFQKPNYKNLFKIFNSKILLRYMSVLYHACLGGGGASKARELRNSTNLLKVLISSKATVWGALRASFTPRAM